MNIPLKTLETGFSFPELGLGTWKIGGGRTADYSRDDEWLRSLENALRMGYTHLDTAEEYGDGHSEELVGRAIKKFDRNGLIIATKVSDDNLRYDDVLNAVEKSVERLDIEQIDLCYVHFPNPDIPIKETMKAFSKLIADGLVKHVGVSNFSVEEFKEAQYYCDSKIVANQIEYSLLTRDAGKYRDINMESEIVPYCQENDVFVVAERPIERGAVKEYHPLMEEMSKKYGKTYIQIALNWLISQKNVVIIPKAEKPEHQEENLGSVGWYMEEEDVEKLREGIEADELSS